MYPASATPLDEDEFNRIDHFLEIIGSGMNMEQIDGLFTALLCAPGVVPASDWLPGVMGGEPILLEEAQSSKIIGLLMQHWNGIANALAHTLDDPEAFVPVLAESDDGIAHGNDWARGFMRGVEMRAQHWAGLMHDERHVRWMQPILTLHHEHDPDFRLRSTILTDHERNALLDELPASVCAIYRFFEPQRNAQASGAAATPNRRVEAKIGRNDPCPCGSGRKYKQCCGKNG